MTIIREFHLGPFQFRDTQSIIIDDLNKENNLNRNSEKQTSESKESFTLISYFGLKKMEQGEDRIQTHHKSSLLSP